LFGFEAVMVHSNLFGDLTQLGQRQHGQGREFAHSNEIG
jgi:hypothetical protein